MSSLKLSRGKLFQAFFSLLFVVSLTACADSPLTQTPVVITPSPVPTTLAPTPTSSSPIDQVDYVIEPGVSAEEQEQIKKAVELAVKAYGPVNYVQLIAKNMLPHGLLLAEEDDDTTGTATPSQIVIYTADSTGQRLSKTQLVITILHEYYHLVQYQWAGLNMVTGLSQGRDVYPLWMVEGSAEYEAYRVAAQNNLVSYERSRGEKIAYANRYNFSLKQIEKNSSLADYAPYSLGFLAVELLVTRYGGEPALKSYWQELSKTGQKWESAFQKSFGISTNAFYVQFDIYRRSKFVGTN